MDEFRNNDTACIYSLNEAQKVYESLLSWYLSGMGSLIIGTDYIAIDFSSTYFLFCSYLSFSTFQDFSKSKCQRLKQGALRLKTSLSVLQGTTSKYQSYEKMIIIFCGTSTYPIYF